MNRSFFSTDCIIRPAKLKDMGGIHDLITSKKILVAFSTLLTITCFIYFKYLLRTKLSSPIIAEIRVEAIIIDLVLPVLFFICFYLFMLLLSSLITVLCISSKSNSLIAIVNNKIVGFITLAKYRDGLMIYRLVVSSKYKRQGIVTRLVKSAVAKSDRKVYVGATPQLIGFYKQLGFSYTSDWDRKKNDKIVDALTIDLVSQQNDISFLDNKPNKISKYAINRATQEDIYHLKVLLLQNPTFLMSFGIDLAVQKLSITVIFIFLIPLFATLTLNPFIAFLSSLIFGLGYGIILFYFLTMHKHINHKTISQFELVKYGESLLGLMRLHRKNNYSVLNNVYISSPSLLPRNSDLKIKGLIAEYLVKETNKPLYVACNKKWAKFYQQSGFVPVKVQRIPQKLRLGARINLLVGGVNLVFA